MLLQPSGFLLWMQSIWMEIEPCDFGKATFEKTPPGMITFFRLSKRALNAIRLSPVIVYIVITD